MDQEVEEVSFLPGGGRYHSCHEIADKFKSCFTKTKTHISCTCAGRWETILNKKAVYEPSKGQRFRQVVCTRSWAVVILIAMGVAMVAVAVIAAFARPAGPMKLACGSTSDNANSSSAALSADPSAPVPIDQSSLKASPFIATNGEEFPWEDLRLPPFIRPLEYNILVHPNISESYFTGRVTMTLSVVENTDFIVFHASGLNISKVRAFEGKMDEARRDKEGFSDIMFDTELDLKRRLEYLAHEQHYVQMGSMLSAATFLQLVVDFRGSLAGLTSMRGLYKSLYTVGEEKRYMVSTHFEATFAREAFPCLDEPQLKAKFTMSLVRDKNHISLFNTPLLSTSPYEHDLVLDQYEPTREMSTYLVAYVVCDFKNISKVTRDGVTVRVFAPEDKIYMGQYALDTAVTVLEYYTSFFGIPYPLPKQDLIAIPNFAAGAMENWGLITYRDTAVLYDPNMSSESSKKWVATVVAHELAHQWFGNLVTMKWWNDLWLNEGFASFVEYIGVESVDKDFHMMDSFISALGDALYLDSFPSSHPIQVKVEDPAEIMAVFDKISYDKGASLIRMLRGFMGETDFKAGLTSYLKKYSYSNAETKDLWDSFQEAGKLPPDLTVAKVMDTWTLQMGYPVVSITRQQGKLLLSQERFLLSEGSPTDDSKFVSPFGYTWHVPFTYMTSEDPSNRHLVWMKRTSAAIELPSSPLAWLKANVDTRGYYRVNYDQEGWQAIIQQLNTDHKVFSVLDRAGLLDDAFSLARSGRLSYAVALDMTLYLSKETSIFVWAAASSHISFLKGRLYLDEDYDVLKAHMFSLAKTQYEKLGWTNEGTHLEKKMRAFMISLAISSEYQPAVDKAVDIFGQWKANQSVSQDYVSGVDINMGCPKEFSIKGGMGAALITQPEKVKNILTTLVEELNVPVTCKIRVLPKLEETVQLARLIESTGVSAIAVHGRTKEERSRDVNRDDYIKAIVAAVNIPVIANGGSKTISCISDIATFQHRTGASSVMVARAAEWNCSVFRKDGPLPVLDVLRSYLQLAFLYDNNETNTKYNVLQIVRSKMTELEQADKSLTAKSLEDFANIWDMKTEYMDIMEARRVREQDLTTQIVDENCGAKRCRTTSGAVLIELPVRFDKRFYSTKMSPKQILNNWLKKCNGDKAVYDTVERENDRCFNSTVNVGGTLYTNPYWEKSKQRAEQGAAICCLIANGESDGCLSKPCSETEDLKRKWIATIHASDNDEPSEKSQKVSNEDGAGPVN